MKIMVLLCLSAIGFLKADVSQDLASLEVRLMSLSKLVPATTAPTAVPKSEYTQWPKGTKIMYKGRWADFFDVVLRQEKAAHDAGTYMVPVSTEVKPVVDVAFGPSKIPVSLGFTVVVGRLSYTRWAASDFFAPFVVIDKSEYENFLPGVEITIAQARPTADAVLKVGKDGRIANIGNYIDDDERLISVQKLKLGSYTQDLTRIQRSSELTDIFERFQEEDEPSDDDDDDDFDF